MKKILSIGLVVFIACSSRLMAQTNSVAVAEPSANSIAVSIVYDGSGSMADTVAGADKQPTPKYLIANKAIGSIIKQLRDYSQKKQTTIQAGMVYFVDSKIHEAVPMSTLTPASSKLFTQWAGKFTVPAGGTPLGDAIRQAQAQLASSPSIHKHILVITDGASNTGMSPEKVMHGIRASDNPVPVYFVAFDISDKVFDRVKKEGATVVSASDEAQLNVQLSTILGQKILLEAE